MPNTRFVTKDNLASVVTAMNNHFVSEETDPTVPSWAKAASKPTYTAQEVGALPADTAIPTKVSDLDNDSGFITSVPGATSSVAGIVKYDGTSIKEDSNGALSVSFNGVSQSESLSSVLDINDCDYFVFRKRDMSANYVSNAIVTLDVSILNEAVADNTSCSLSTSPNGTHYASTTEVCDEVRLYPDGSVKYVKRVVGIQPFNIYDFDLYYDSFLPDFQLWQADQGVTATQADFDAWIVSEAAKIDPSVNALEDALELFMSRWQYFRFVLDTPVVYDVTNASTFFPNFMSKLAAWGSNITVPDCAMHWMDDTLFDCRAVTVSVSSEATVEVATDSAYGVVKYDGKSIKAKSDGSLTVSFNDVVPYSETVSNVLNINECSYFAFKMSSQPMHYVADEVAFLGVAFNPEDYSDDASCSLSANIGGIHYAETPDVADEFRLYPDLSVKYVKRVAGMRPYDIDDYGLSYTDFLPDFQLLQGGSATQADYDAFIVAEAKKLDPSISTLSAATNYFARNHKRLTYALDTPVIYDVTSGSIFSRNFTEALTEWGDGTIVVDCAMHWFDSVYFDCFAVTAVGGTTPTVEVATDSTYGVVMYDNDTIKVNSEGKLYVALPSLDSVGY